MSEFALNEGDADLLVADRHWAAYFEEAVKAGGDAKSVCNWMNSDFAKMLNETGEVARADGKDDDERTVSKVTPQMLVELTALVSGGEISGKAAKEVFSEVFRTGEAPQSVVERKGLSQVSDAGQIQKWVEEAMLENQEAVQSFRNGKTGVIGFLVGKAIQKSGGRANPGMVQEAMRKSLE